MCGKKLSLILLVLLFCCSLYAQPDLPQASRPFSAYSQDGLEQTFLQATATILKNWPQAKPLLLQMQTVLAELAARSLERQTILEIRLAMSEQQAMKLQSQVTSLEASLTSLQANLQIHQNLSQQMLQRTQTERDLSLTGNGLLVLSIIGLEIYHAATVKR